MRPLRLSALLVVALLAVAACSEVTGTEPPGVAVRIDDTTIAVDEVEDFLDPLGDLQAYDEVFGNPQMRAELTRELVTILVHRELFAMGAVEHDVELDEDAVEERFLQQTGAEDPDQQREVLAEGGMTPELLRAQLETQGYLEALAAELGERAGIDDDDRDAAYEELYGGVPSARHILLDTEEDAEDVLDRLDDGEDFGDLAEEVSTDPTAEDNRGELGEITPGQYDPDFASAVEEAEDGEVVGPVETQFGFHVIERLEPPDRDEVADEIEEAAAQRAGDEALQAWVSDFLDELEIVVNPRFGTWDPDAVRVVEAEGLDAPEEDDALEELGG